MAIEDVKVVVLAGGKGTRLRPYTTVFPKPLMPIGDMPILEVVLRQLRSFGFRQVVISVNHLAELIQTFFRDGASLGLEISYCVEDRPMGTAGSLSLVPEVSDPFVVMNGDLLTTLDYSDILGQHRQSGADATIGACRREVKIDFGVLDIGAEGELVDYREKPLYEYFVSMGVNVFSRSALSYIPAGEYLDIPTLMMRLKAAGKAVHTYRSECEWLDIGRAEDYELAVHAFEERRALYLREPA
jgi:NDP-sugar pyrophosphorylase family protein